MKIFLYINRTLEPYIYELRQLTFSDDEYESDSNIYWDAPY